MVFIAAGMEEELVQEQLQLWLSSKAKRCINVGIVTKPFSFEGKRRMRQAEEGISRLAENVDTLIVIPNDRLKNSAGASIQEAFRNADDVLRMELKV